MGFGEAISSGFRNYVGFSGRAARSEFWFWALFTTLVYVAALAIDSLIVRNANFAPFTTIVALAFLLPSLAMQIRRLHDRDKSGWFWLLGLIPLVGGIILLVWYCMRGTIGPNRFGPDPLEGKV
jgi:uncharacterized membrane protein YhaH (DUF805 family)